MTEIEKCRICQRYGHQESCTTHLQHFVWRYGGKDVSLIGEWTYFQIPIALKPMEDGSGYFECYVQLYPKVYRYKYLVDGLWKNDPNETMVPNNYGSSDNTIQVFPAVYEVSEDESESEGRRTVIFHNKGTIIKIKTDLKGNTIILKGSWDNWTTEICIQQGHVYIKLLPGVYQFKFIVDGVWLVDKSLMKHEGENGVENNIIKIKEKNSCQQSLFDPHNLQWSQIKMDGLNFTAIQGHSMSCIGNNIYVFGGFYHHKFLNTTYMIDIEQQEVHVQNQGYVPEERAYHQSVEYGNKIIIFGGLNQNQVFNDYLLFNTMSKVWNKSSLTGDIPTPREHFTLTRINNDILMLFGGYECSEDESYEVNYNDFYQLDLIKMQWTKLQIENNIKPRSGHAGVSWKQKLFLYGGVERESCSPKTVFQEMLVFNYYEMDLQNITTQIKGETPVGRYGHCGIEVKNNYIIYGGKNIQGQLLNDVWIFDMQSYDWIQPIISGVDPGARWHHRFCKNQQDEIFMLGGFKGRFVQRKDFIYKLSSFVNKDIL